jgi:hypothetical protein
MVSATRPRVNGQRHNGRNGHAHAHKAAARVSEPLSPNPAAGPQSHCQAGRCLLEKLDELGKSYGIDRTGMIAKAIADLIARHAPAPSPTPAAVPWYRRPGVKLVVSEVADTGSNNGWHVEVEAERLGHVATLGTVAIVRHAIGSAQLAERIADNPDLLDTLGQGELSNVIDCRAMSRPDFGPCVQSPAPGRIDSPVSPQQAAARQVALIIDRVERWEDGCRDSNRSQYREALEGLRTACGELYNVVIDSEMAGRR